MCKCISYNQPEKGQEDQEVIIQPPFLKRTICVDFCITKTIKYLWDNGIETLGSCCGHNKENPSIILTQNITNAEQIRALIKQVDSRDWKIMSWILTEI